MNKRVTPSTAYISDAPKKRIIKAKEFLSSFRETPDDFQLMEKYGISSKQLRRLYSTLIEEGLLTEFEYNQRERKAPELEEYSPPSAFCINCCELG
jgi:hypothetical protein